MMNNLIYIVLSAVWLILISMLAYYYYRNRDKFHLQATIFNTEVEQLRNKIDYFHQHADQLKKEQIKKLHEEFEQLNIGLKSMQRTLESSHKNSNRNSILLSNISHTLRTNLNDLLGFSTLLSTEFAMTEEDELFEYSENIHKSSESLMHLLNNIIDISRIDAKTFGLQLENCNLTALTTEIINSYEGIAGQKGIKIVFQDEQVPVFSGDGQSLRHILSNLIDNAIRFTEKGFIKIQQKMQDNQVIWSIKDTGIGIDKAYLPDIFEPFRRQSLGYSKTAYQGAGLGLPLVKQLLELMKGRIELDSQKAIGTTVTIFLPFHVPLADETKKEKLSTSAPKSKTTKLSLKKPLNRILVIDGDRMNNMLIKKMLPNSETDFAPFEKKLLQMLEMSIQKGLLYEIMIIETNFETPSGGIHWRKKIPQLFPIYKNTPVIALSSFPEMNEEKKLLQNGFNSYTSKPINKEKLYNSINQVLSS